MVSDSRSDQTESTEGTTPPGQGLGLAGLLNDFRQLLDTATAPEGASGDSGERPATDPRVLADLVGELERLMANEKDLEAVTSWHDQMVSVRRDFWEASKRAQYPQLADRVDAITRAAVRETKRVDYLLLNVARHGMWHGLFLYEPEQVALLIYFDSLDLGIITVPELSTGQCHRERFSLK